MRDVALWRSRTRASRQTQRHTPSRFHLSPFALGMAPNHICTFESDVVGQQAAVAVLLSWSLYSPLCLVSRQILSVLLGHARYFCVADEAFEALVIGA